MHILSTIGKSTSSSTFRRKFFTTCRTVAVFPVPGCPDITDQELIFFFNFD